jgi:hypothetical protein
VKKQARKKATRRKKTRSTPVEAAPVTAAELQMLRNELQRRMQAPRPRTGDTATSRKSRRQPPMRWNPEPEDVQKSVAQLVLTIVEFLRKLMERQAIRRMEQNTLTKDEVEAVGRALLELETTVREMGKRFGLEPEDLNLDLGPIKLI